MESHASNRRQDARDTYMNDPWACYEDDARFCGAEEAPEDEACCDCCCCCC